MNCQHYRDIMFDYFEAELSSTEREDINLHLQNCEYCRRQYELTRLENQVLHDTYDIPEIDDAFNLKVMSMIKAGAGHQQKPSAFKKKRFRWLPIYSKATIAAVLLVACFSVPAILPELPGQGGPQKAALLENSAPATNGIVSKENSGGKDISLGNSKEMADKNYSAQYNDNAEIDVRDGNNDSQVINTPSPTAFSQPETDFAGLRSMPAPAEYKTAMPTYGQVDQAESSRALKSDTRIVTPNVALPNLNRIPGDYVLQATKFLNEKQVQYSYADPNRDKNFLLNLALVEPVADIVAVAGLAEAEDQGALMTKEPKTIEMENLASFQNQTRRIVEHNGLKYQIILTGTMDKEELDRLADEITLVTPSAE